jgi:hypothetical protein
MDEHQQVPTENRSRLQHATTKTALRTNVYKSDARVSLLKDSNSLLELLDGKWVERVERHGWAHTQRANQWM